MTLKEIKRIATAPMVTDLTNATHEGVTHAREREGGFETLATSSGAYGVTGWLGVGRTSGRVYVVTSRSVALFTVL